MSIRWILMVDVEVCFVRAPSHAASTFPFPAVGCPYTLPVSHHEHYIVARHGESQDTSPKGGESANQRNNKAYRSQQVDHHVLPSGRLGPPVSCSIPI